MTSDKFQLSLHAKAMLVERSIEEEWLWDTLLKPDEIVDAGEGKLYYLKAIPAFEHRVLRVIVSAHASPSRVVTLYFDRTLRQK